jgi:SAM-dependent methyltransferase
MKTSTKRTTCRLCQSPRLDLAVPIKPSPIADAYIPAARLAEAQELYALDLYLCADCGHVQLLEVVDPKVLFANYIYTTSISLGLVEHFRKYADQMISRFAAAPGSLVVDIGSNDGTLLKFFKDRGLRVLGVDPATEIARQATQSGVPTLAGFFTSDLARRLRADHGPAALVTANNVFAHSDSLADMAEGIRELLAENGVFIFEVSYLVDILEKKLFDTVYHEHLCYHSVKPLVSFFERHGLELFDIERLPNKGGSLRAFVQRRGGPRAVAPIVSELLALEQKLGLAQLPVFKSFAAELDAIKSELLQMLRGLAAGGARIAGYGASATVTTLIYNFELGPFLEFLVDDNTARHGWFSPGQHLAILPPAALLERQAGYAVLLAWQYADPIVKKSRVFIDSGGRFILPMPKARLL